MSAGDFHIREIEETQTLSALPALQLLRPAYATAAELSTAITLQRQDGYRLVGVFEAGDSIAASVAGFRLAHTLSWGRHIYLDDLSTLPAFRSRGYGAALLSWLAAEADRLQCDSLQLDSGLDASRKSAHRLYFNAGYRINSFHFERSCRAET